MRETEFVLALVAALAVAGCVDLVPGDPGAGAGPVPGPVPGDCDFETHRVGVEVHGVEANLTRAGVYDAWADYRASACAAPPRWSDLEVQGPSAASGQVPDLRDVDGLWLFTDDGLARLGTNVTVDQPATLRVEARGPPVREANLTWAGQAGEVGWTEWFDDPEALHPREVGTGERPLEDGAGNFTFPVNSSRNDGIRLHLRVDVDGARHPNWSAYDGSLEGVLLEASLEAPNGSTAAAGNWTASDGADPERIHVPGDEAGAAGNWTVRYRVHQGQADPGDLVYRVEAGVSYGVPTD